MAEQNLPKDVQQALENLTGADREFLKTVVSEKGELNGEALKNVSGGVSLSKAGTTTLNWLKNNYGKVAVGVGVIGLGVLGCIYKDEIRGLFDRPEFGPERDALLKLTPEQREYAKGDANSAHAYMKNLANASGKKKSDPNKI